MKLQKVFIALLSSFFAVFPIKTAFNCVDFADANSIRVSHFFSNILPFNELINFYYEPDHYTYSTDDESIVLSEADELNVQEWKQKLNDKSITDKDVISFLYELKPENYWKNKAAWDLNNRFLQTAKTKFPEAFTYLQILKDVNYDIGEKGWYGNWNENETITNRDQHLKEKLEELYHKTTDSFLKRRYAYKLISLYYYDYWIDGKNISNIDGKNPLTELFNLEFEKGNKDWMYYSAKHYYALEQGEDALLEVYINAKDKRGRTADLLTKIYLQTKFKQSKNAEEKATCLAIQMFRNPGPCLNEIKTVYNLQPTNRDFKFLVTREVNKLENWLWSKQISGMNFNDEFWYDESEKHFVVNYKNDLAYAGNVNQFLKQVYNQKTTKDDDKLFLSLAISYIDILRGSFSSANSYLKDLSTYKDNKYALQAKVILFLLDLHTKEIDKNFEPNLLNLLTEIKQNNKIDAAQYYVQQLTRTVAEFLKTKPAYRAKGFLLNTQNDLIRSNGYYYLNEMYKEASVNDIDEILAIIRKQNKTNFETMITQGVYHDYFDDTEYRQPIDTLRLIDYKGLKLMRENKLAEAYQVYASLSDSILNTEPFSYVRDDVFMFRYQHADEFIYNKKTFLAQLIKYKQQLLREPNNALVNFYVGNAYMNMTLHGNAWPMMSDYISSSVENKEYAKLINHHYVYGDWALPFYKKALQYVKDEKLKVLIQINIAFIKNIDKDPSFDEELSNLKSLCNSTKEFDNLLLVYTNCDMYYDYINNFVRKGNRIAKQRYWNRNYYY
ncbi:MAG: hypothetical protein JHD28_00775 [Bacteroidia bacterium]|nr:hypothetical protein [Bacteroidia bacterium]